MSQGTKVKEENCETKYHAVFREASNTPCFLFYCLIFSIYRTVYLYDNGNPDYRLRLAQTGGSVILSQALLV